MKNMHYANRNHKKAAMSMLKSGKVDFKTRSISEFKYIKQIWQIEKKKNVQL